MYRFPARPYLSGPELLKFFRKKNLGLIFFNFRKISVRFLTGHFCSNTGCEYFTFLLGNFDLISEKIPIDMRLKILKQIVNILLFETSFLSLRKTLLLRSLKFSSVCTFFFLGGGRVKCEAAIY